jgi:hypothetical protein
MSWRLLGVTTLLTDTSMECWLIRDVGLRKVTLVRLSIESSDAALPR